MKHVIHICVSHKVGVDNDCERLQTGVSFSCDSFLTISFLRTLETRAMIKFKDKVEAENSDIAVGVLQLSKHSSKNTQALGEPTAKGHIWLLDDPLSVASMLEQPRPRLSSETRKENLFIEKLIFEKPK